MKKSAKTQRLQLRITLVLAAFFVIQTVPSLLGDVFDVTDYGAIGDGINDDTGGIQAALTASANNGILYFPKGDYLVTGSLISVSGSVFIEGEGSGTTRVILEASGVTLFDLLTDSPEESVTIKDISLENRSAATDNTALKVDYPFTDSTHKNNSLVAERLHIIATSGYWEKGVVLRHAWNSKFDQCYFTNSEGTKDGDAVFFEERSVNSHFTDCSFSWWRKGIGINAAIPNAQEGIVITGCTFVPVTFGIYYDNPSSTDGTLPIWVTLTNSHIDARGDLAACVYLNPVRVLQISNCNLIVVSDGPGQYGYCVLANAITSIFNGNAIGETALPGSPAFQGSGGIVLLGEDNHLTFDSKETVLIGNTFTNFNSGATVWVQTGATDNRILYSLFINCTTPINDQGNNTDIIGNGLSVRERIFARRIVEPPLYGGRYHLIRGL